MKNCILIGYDAGVDLPADSKNIVIIGDGIRCIDKDKYFNCCYIGDEKHLQIIIGTELFGEKINLKDVLKNHFTMIKELQPDKWNEIEIKNR
jgi:hypothetical protein|tara:strand:+ start:1508 stop:1783 length:276 start_codon:yes stop_codon:yes gene_type:complete